MKNQLIKIAGELEKVASYIEQETVKIKIAKEEEKKITEQKIAEAKASVNDEGVDNSATKIAEAADTIGQIETKTKETRKQARELDPIAAFALGD